jgi:hypothetical protein
LSQFTALSPRKAFGLGCEAMSEINGFALWFENYALSQLRCFSVHYNEVAVESFSNVTMTNEEIPRGKLGHIVNNVSHCRAVIDKGGNKGVFDGVASITTDCS